MRFSIRDLMWLMAVVALAATVFTDRQHMLRQRAKLAEEKVEIEEQASAAVDAAQKRLVPLRHDNAILRHQIVVQMEKQMQLERQLDLSVQRDDRTLLPARFGPVATPAPDFQQ